MFTQYRMFGSVVVALAVLPAFAIPSAPASADDARVTVAPAIYRVEDASVTPVQTVQWYGGGYWYRPYRPYYFRSYYRPYYYGGYYQPYYGSYYRPYSYGYGYGYPAYGYTYGYPAYGYYGYGPGVTVGRVGMGVW
jgi:hypothetical protein